MVEKIDRLEPKNERRITVLLQSRRSKQDCLETMRCTSSYDSSKPAHRITSRLSIVRKIVEPPLHFERSIQLTYQAPLGWCEIEWRTLHYCLLSSIVQMSLCLSPIVK